MKLDKAVPQRQVAAISELFERHGIMQTDFSPVVLVQLFSFVSRLFVTQRNLGLSECQAEIVQFIEQTIANIEARIHQSSSGWQKKICLQQISGRLPHSALLHGLTRNRESPPTPQVPPIALPQSPRVRAASRCAMPQIELHEEKSQILITHKAKYITGDWQAPFKRADIVPFFFPRTSFEPCIPLAFPVDAYNPNHGRETNGFK